MGMETLSRPFSTTSSSTADLIALVTAAVRPPGRFTGRRVLILKL
jgi:hypothetical protein